MIEITALVLTYNEGDNIARAVDRLRSIPQVLLIDSFSTDDTIEIATQTHPKVRVLQRAFDTFAAQCNFGLEQISTPWVLSIDADYILTPALTEEITHLSPPVGVAGYRARFSYCISGHRLRSSLYPPRTVLYRRSLASYREDGHGHRVIVEGPIRNLCGKIEHDDRKPLSRWISSQVNYSRIEARHLIQIAETGTQKVGISVQDRLRLKVYFAAPVVLLYLLFGRGLILDGWRGWYYVAQRTIAELLLSLQLLIREQRLEEDAEDCS